MLFVRREIALLAPLPGSQAGSSPHLAGCRAPSPDPLLIAPSGGERNGNETSNDHVGQVSQHSGSSALFDPPEPARGSLCKRGADDATTQPDPQPDPLTPRPCKRNKRQHDDRLGALFGRPPSVPLPLLSVSSKGGPPPTRPSTSTTSDGPPSRICPSTANSPGQPLSRPTFSAKDSPLSQAPINYSRADGPPSTLPVPRAVLLVQRSPSPPPGPQPLALPLGDGGRRYPRVRRHSILEGLPWYSSTPPRGSDSPSLIKTPGWWLSSPGEGGELYAVDTLALVRRKLEL